MDIYNFEKAKSAEFSAVGMDGLYQEIERAKRNCITSASHLFHGRCGFFEGDGRGMKGDMNVQLISRRVLDDARECASFRQIQVARV